MQRYLQTRDPRAYRLSDVITPAAFHQRALYHEVFVPLGVEHQLAVTLPAPPRLLIGRCSRTPTTSATRLSPREAQVLQAMMRGHATAAIATQLEISPRTIHKHAQSIYGKLGVNDRIAAVSAAWAALDSGLGTPH